VTHTLAYVPNPAATPDPQKKQVLNRPVFLPAKCPVPESGEVWRFPVKLPAKTPETGRSGYPRKWRSGPAAGPDGWGRECRPIKVIMAKQ